MTTGNDGERCGAAEPLQALASTSEIGVRLALGPGASNVARMMVPDNFRPVAAGLLVGLLAAAGLGLLLEALLFGLLPTIR